MKTRYIPSDPAVTRTVEIFDTTLRDGEQTPGISFTNEQKQIIARQLDRLGVDIIEAGTPVTSKEEKEIVKLICDESKTGSLSAKICGLARLLRADIDACIDCGLDIIHIFVPSSRIQREETTKMSEERVKEQTYEMTRYVKDHGFLCLFSAMDATRTRLEYLIDLYRTAEEAGADILNVPDTVGVSEPFSIYELVTEIYHAVTVPISIHCHNDFGLAVANSLAAVKAGAANVHVSVNGLGERAGNADLAETVMSLNSIYRLKTNIRTEYLFETAKLVERFSSVKIPITRPIVGENAFSHESGIHAHGVIAKSETFEPGIMTPEMVGHRRRIVLGKHTGRHSIAKKLSEIGMTPSNEELDKILEWTKKAGAGEEVTDDELFSKTVEVIGISRPEKITIENFVVMTGLEMTPVASLTALIRGEERKSEPKGVGPVDAAIKAIQEIIGIETGGDIKLIDFQLKSLTSGSDAEGVAVVAVKKGDVTVTAKDINKDIVVASIRAFIKAVNWLI